ncbi:hypothetical protein SLS55_001990 [Diplodia seriata]|uniref:Uncharacterized protein n=1 Tax=Diplodia seriata TaxID=420778 RepID=A0ABR3CQX1_9PEZI
MEQDCANYLAGTYVELGRKAATENDGKALEKYVSELQELHDAIIKLGRITVNKKVILLLGRLYHLQARKEEAKKCFRDHVGTCLELLSDEDPSNDYQAYMGLGESLGRLYDDENALAAWSMIGPRNRSTDDPRDRYEGMTSKPSGPLYYRCANGECDHIWRFANDIYVCRDCIDCMFCEKCHTELKTGRMEWRVCGKDHEFLYVPKWDSEAAEKVEKGHVKVGNDPAMKIADWVDKLRREYGIEVPEDGAGST